ncbi:MAG: flagellar filament capping protein FliD [Microthrixaceae bacterium]
MAVDGLVSGLDTTQIIESLMAIERQPQVAMVARQTTAKNQLDAYKSIRDKMAALGTAATNLATASKWNARTATSSSPSTATVSSTSTGSLGSLTFTVDRLATAHGVRSANTSATADTIVASSGTITVDLGDGAGPQAVDVGGGTLSEVATALNKADLGLRAAVVNTGNGYHLQVDSATTGADSTFTLGGLDPAVGGTVATNLAQDAQLTIGSGPGAYAVTSASNTFTDLLPGVSITAVSASTTPVTTTVSENVQALSDAVKALVDAANAALRTAYDSKNKMGATLNGDSAVRRAAQEITRAVIDIVDTSSLGSAGLAGVKLERTGKFTFDAEGFKTAYTKDPAAVRALFAQSGTATDGNVSFVSSGSRAQSGTYAVEVTTAAAQATTTGLTDGWPLGAATTVGVRIGTTEATYEIGAGESAADAAAGLQAAIDAAGLRLEVTESGGGLALSTLDFGASATFDVAWDGVTHTTHAGVDVAGTIDGVAAVGKGQQLQIDPVDPRLGGLAVLVTGSTTGPQGTITYGAGIAQRLASAVTRSNDLVDGYLTNAEKGKQNKIDTLATSITDYDRRLEVREARLRTYWASLEVTLGKLKDQSSWLASQIGSLSANGAS